MKRASFICATLISISLSVAPLEAQPQKESRPGSQEQKGQPSERATLTGVVDQSGENYILADTERVQPLAVLHGKGFTDDNFARFVGLRVTISGDMVTEGGRKVLYVRNLSDIQRLPPEKK
jgi:hypothetical protein